MENNNNLEEFKAALFNRKQVNFRDITESNFPTDAEVVFSDSKTTIRRIRNVLYIATTFCGRIQNSYFNIYGISGGALSEVEYGYIPIGEIKDYTGHLKPLRSGLTKPIEVDRKKDPVSFLTIWHQKRQKPVPRFVDEPNGSKGELLSIKVVTSFGSFVGTGVTKQIAKKEAADLALTSINL